MSIKNLFNKKSFVVQSAASASIDAESSQYLSASVEEIDAFIPTIDFRTASNFVKYGSAELYYENAIKRIYQQYPYDGSLAEQKLYHLSSSALDRWIFNYKYPKSTGYINLGENYGSKVGDVGDYEAYGNLEWIRINGGIHTSSAGMIGKPLYKTFDSSNIYHTASNRTHCLKTDLSDGVTVEFWLRKKKVKQTAKNEVIFDLWNGNPSGSTDHGRLTLEYDTSSGSKKRFLLTLHSGSFGGTSKGFERQGIGPVQGAAIDDWTHYAVSIINDTSQIRVRFYVNGKENTNDLLGTGIMGEFSGKINAHIGSLIANPVGNTYHNSNSTQYKGWGRLTGSMDEFRFWKKRRSSKEIEKNWFHPIGGGQNSKHPDEQKNYLGVYYKFNEGITGDNSIDSIVLDYSGRISNGIWNSYSSQSQRVVGSAFEISKTLEKEPADPIIYPEHPSVSTLLANMKMSGSLHDQEAGMFLYDTIPAWIREEDESFNFNTKKLVQVVASYFDTLYTQVSHINRIREKRYFEIDNPNYEDKPHSFAKKMLEHQGFLVSEIFPNNNVMQYFMDRDENATKYSMPIDTVKNIIYQNIYNNLEYIYKTKGTEVSIRNLIRCFGIDDELLKINLYTDKGTHYFRDRFKHTSFKKKYIDFNHRTRFSGSLYQTGSSVNPLTYIKGEGSSQYLERATAFSYEADIIVPYKIKQYQEGYFNTPFLTASIFGQHRAKSTSTDYTWESTDSNEFQVYLIRKESESSDAYFMLTSSTLGVELTSSLYKQIYDNQRWNLAVRVRPDTFPYVDGYDSSSAPSYTIDFYGVNHSMEVVHNEFHLSKSLSNNQGLNFATTNKRIYAGAHLTNFTGSTVHKTDIQIGGVRFWADYLENDIIKLHSLDPSSVGGNNEAYSNSTIFTPTLTGSHIPKYDMAGLIWDFDTVTGSDSTGLFVVEDASSGSASTLYGWIDNLINKENRAKSINFPTSSQAMISPEFIFSSKKELPEISFSNDTIHIKGDEEKFFIEDDDVSDNFLSIEKSMYQIISEEMLNTFSSVKEFSNLMGKAQDRYTFRYERLEHLRKIFFKKVNESPDFDKFTEYFKWIDSSISMMIGQLIPASLRHSEEISNMYESHILERNKYQNKFPLTQRYESTEAHLRGAEELSYNWKFSHAPVDSGGNPPQNKNCFWWKERAIRTETYFGGATKYNKNKEEIRNVIISEVSSSNINQAKSDKTIYQGSTYAIRKFSKPLRMRVDAQETLHLGTNYDRRKNRNIVHSSVAIHGDTNPAPVNVLIAGVDVGSGLDDQKDCLDITKPDMNSTSTSIISRKTKRFGFVEHGRHYKEDYSGSFSLDVALPFNIYTNPASSGVDKIVMQDYTASVTFTNLHSDTYGNLNDIGFQGPFTQQWVGGHQHRHVNLNKGADNVDTRPEAWRVFIKVASLDPNDPFTGGQDPDIIFGVVGPDYGGPYPDPNRKYAVRYREETTKRPLNIKNHKTIRPLFGSNGNFITTSAGQIMTGSVIHGNYYSNYEIVQIPGRSINNLYSRKFLGSKDVDTYELFLISEALANTGSLIYQEETLLTDTTNYSSLYGRRASLLHNDGNIFLRQPKYFGAGATNPLRYGININSADNGFRIRKLMDWWSLKTSQPTINNWTFAGWSNLRSASFSTDGHVVVARLGNVPTEGSQINFSRPKGASKFHVELVQHGGSTVGIFRTTNSYDFDEWHHVVVHYSGKTLRSMPIIYVDGVKQEVNMLRAPSPSIANATSNPSFFYLGTGVTSANLLGSFVDSPVQHSFFGAIADFNLWYQPDININGPREFDKFAKRHYNRGFFIDPNNLSDDKKIFWYTMGRSTSDTITQFSNLIKLGDSGTTISIDLEKGGSGTNTFLTPSTGTGINAPQVIDTSGYHWEWAFDKKLNRELSPTGSYTDSVIVSRFSSPGGPEQMSLGFLDIRGNEMSVYNALPFRNTSVLGNKMRVTVPTKANNYSKNMIGGSGEVEGMSVQSLAGTFQRVGLKPLLTEYSRAQGLYSDTPTSKDISVSNLKPSFHKQQRNTSIRPTGELYDNSNNNGNSSLNGKPELKYIHDNAYINTPIPRSDFQYSWITSSLGSNYSIHSGKQVIYGYAPRSGKLDSPTRGTRATGFIDLSTVRTIPFNNTTQALFDLLNEPNAESFRIKVRDHEGSSAIFEFDRDGIFNPSLTVVGANPGGPFTTQAMAAAENLRIAVNASILKMTATVTQDTKVNFHSTIAGPLTVLPRITIVGSHPSMGPVSYSNNFTNGSAAFVEAITFPSASELVGV